MVFLIGKHTIEITSKTLQLFVISRNGYNMPSSERLTRENSFLFKMSLSTLSADLLIYLASFLNGKYLIRFGSINQRCRKSVQKRIDFSKLSCCLNFGNPRKSIRLDDLKIFHLLQASCKKTGHGFDERLCYLYALYYNSTNILNLLTDYREKIDDVILLLFFEKLNSGQEFHPRIFKFLEDIKELKPNLLELKVPIWVSYLLGKYSEEEAKSHLDLCFTNFSFDCCRQIIFFLNGGVLPSSNVISKEMQRNLRFYLHNPFCREALAKIGISLEEKMSKTTIHNFHWTLNLVDSSGRLLSPEIKQIIKSDLPLDEKKKLLAGLNPDNWIYFYSLEEGIKGGYLRQYEQESIFLIALLRFERVKWSQYFQILSYFWKYHPSYFLGEVLVEIAFKKKYPRLLRFLLLLNQNISLPIYLKILNIRMRLCTRIFRILKVLAEARVPGLLEEMTKMEAIPIYLEYVRLLL